MSPAVRCVRDDVANSPRPRHRQINRPSPSSSPRAAHGRRAPGSGSRLVLQSAPRGLGPGRPFPGPRRDAKFVAWVPDMPRSRDGCYGPRLAPRSSTGQVALSWAALEGTGSAPTGYNVYEGTRPGQMPATPVNGATPLTGTALTVPGLAAGTTYRRPTGRPRQLGCDRWQGAGQPDLGCTDLQWWVAHHRLQRVRRDSAGRAGDQGGDGNIHQPRGYGP